MTELFVEVFPIQPDAIPPLAAYRLEVTGDDPVMVGGRLTLRLARAYGGQWVWVDGRIVTDQPRTTVELMITLDIARAEQPDVYGKVQSIEDDPNWQPDARAAAEFVLRTRVRDLEETLRAALAKSTIKLKNARVEREHKLQAWVVAGQPALSASIASRLIAERDLAAYAQQVSKPKELVGMWVTDKTSSLAGEIVSVTGKAGDHRERLLGLTQRSVMRDLIQRAADDEWVVRVQSGVYEYDYVASALGILVRSRRDEDLQRFEINPKQAQQALRLKPSYRAQLVKIVSDILKNAGVVNSAYNSRDLPDVFLQPAFEAELLYDKKHVYPYNADTLGDDFLRGGVYQRLDKFKDAPIRIAVVNTLANRIDDFVEAMQRQLERQFGFSIEMIRERKVKVVSHKNLESAVKVMEEEQPHIVLAFVGEDVVFGEDTEDADDTARYLTSLTIAKGIASHVIRQETLDRPEAMPTVIMGILGKTGNVPFVLGEPLDYADAIVGLDIVREQKKDGERLTGIARLYRSDGAFVRYAIRDLPLDSEGVIYVLLRDLLPQKEFAKKRVIVHHSGAFSARECETLTSWATAIKAQFALVEILKYDAPRVYALDGGKIVAPGWGSAFRLSDTEAFLVSTSVQHADSTPQPLRIRLLDDAVISIEQALQSVLVWTLLHYGTFRPPRLPVTIQYSDEIAGWLAAGTLPAAKDGDVPFWL
jgi:hypothetical protein